MKLKTIVTFVLALGFSVTASAAKIVVFDYQAALMASESAKQFAQEMKKEFSSEQQSLVDLEKQVKTAVEKIKKNQGLASEEELNKLKLQYQKVFGEFQRQRQALNQKRMQRQQAFAAEFRPKLDKIVREVIKKEGYDLVIDRQATVFNKAELDITPKIVDLLNKQ